jgi:cell division protein FtsN
MKLVIQPKSILQLVALKKRTTKRSLASKVKSAYGTRKNPWLWILSGALAGVLISSSIFLKFNAPNQNNNAITPTKNAEKTSPATKTVATAKTPVFDFYTVLPKMEATPANKPLPTKPTEKTAGDTNQIPKKMAITTPQYLIQVKTFSTLDEADELKAELTLAGFEAKIEATKKNKLLWYRLVIGPFNSKLQAYKQQKLLAKQNIKSNLIELKPEQKQL